MAKAMDVANYLIHLRDLDEESGHYFSLTNLKLQKILYYCQGGHYKWDNDILITDSLFEAWDYGPVIREVYAYFKKFGQNDIQTDEYNFDNLTPSQKDTIEAVWTQLKDMSAFQLVDQTHKEAPWTDAQQNFKVFIENEAIRNFFRVNEEVHN
ncbi:putative phage-associated protein [Planomicrobium stackebrandtii]|uniref:Phage-associated protein n=1 Tax=Planomicrobium stackebrandtii TaxID=253160 RepID=A0ABU0GRT6_9BACL|nr:type II toxin-antitoxin system antitoxin SocA domain-containing protein [Planomicrobium stackebrandtii]MDQ0427659.1 putative phage-associated protein [Planomicrobium stackebrandtii]